MSEPAASSFEGGVKAAAAVNEWLAYLQVLEAWHSHSQQFLDKYGETINNVSNERRHIQQRKRGDRGDAP